MRAAPLGSAAIELRGLLTFLPPTGVGGSERNGLTDPARF